jgi:hypothetical protein
LVVSAYLLERPSLFRANGVTPRFVCSVFESKALLGMTTFLISLDLAA